MHAQAPLPTVDVQRYEGDWYLIGFKPSKLDRNWFNIKETYTWNAAKNRFDVVATYKNESGGKQKSMKEKLLPVANSNNARWIARIGFFIRADYVIYKIADDYSYVVIGHPKQKYVYIMARIPQMEETLYLQLVDFAVGLGYKREEIKKDAKEYGI
jgi:apolipoprotein D and lipocalin family protein